MAKVIYGLTSKDRDAVGRGISRAKNNPLGSRGGKAERRPQQNSGDRYNGMFKVTNTSDETDQKLKIIDGLDSDATNCGRIQVNGFMVDVVVPELTITGDAWIYLEAELVGSPVASSATIEIKQQATELDFEVGYARQLISRVTFADSKITSFSRENVSQFMHVIKRC